MSVDRVLEKSMGMNEATWLRHANPWSGWTRLSILPMLAVAIWSRVWLGWWSLAVIGVIVIWTVVNPRAFPKPRSTDNWMSRGVLGERVWLNRKSVPIPRHHSMWAILLGVVSGVGMVPFGWGLWQLEIWPVALGLVLMMGGKLWFLDRMVWLFADMRDTHEKYQKLLY